MARKKTTETDSPGDFETPGEFTIADTPAQKTDTPQTVDPMLYVGPRYTKGILLHGSRSLIRPASWSQEEIAAFLEEHPERSAWFLPAVKL